MVRSGAATPTIGEQLTENFYRWERRCRGWRVWDAPVELEPPYEPFFHALLALPQAVDDGRRPTLLSTLAERVLGGGYAAPLASPDPEPFEPEPEPLWDGAPLAELRMALPASLKLSPEAAEQFLLSTVPCAHALGFEVIGLPDAVLVQLACRKPDEGLVLNQLEAHFPEVAIHPAEGFLESAWRFGREALVVDFGLSEEFMRPLRTFKKFDTDPLTGVVGALGSIQEEECGILQVLFQRVRHPWAESIQRAVADGEGGSFLADAPEMVTLAREKTERPLFACAIRVGAASPRPGRALKIAQAVAGGLAQLERPESNGLIPLDDEGYAGDTHTKDLLFRRTRRGGMLLNSRELVSLVHLPSDAVRSQKLRREVRKTRSAPPLVQGHRLTLGANIHQGRKTAVTLSAAHRLRHMHVIGATGTGKSTFLLNLILQDIAQGNGVGVIEPHGDLIDAVLDRMPEERHEDVVILDPGDADYPIGFNILSARSELEKTLLSSDLVTAFRMLSTSWGDQMNAVLANAILAFLESAEGGTLADLRRFLVERDFRERFLETVQDPEVVYFWRHEFPLIAGKPQAPLLTRLNTFLRPRIIRHMVSQKESRLDLGAVLDGGKILLAKLAQGAIGEENAYLLGALLVAKLHQLALGRQALQEKERRDFFLYIDEFHNFITPSIASVLSGARKYHLGLILAHQDLHQLLSRGGDVAAAVISNPATRVCFRLGDFDAKKLAEGFSSFNAQDLQNLGPGEAIARVERAEFDFNLRTPPAPPVEEELARERRERLVARSRAEYAVRREEVEAGLDRARPIPPPLPLPRAPRRTGKAVSPVIPPPLPEESRPREALPAPPGEMPPPPGWGGRAHKRLQNTIKHMGEAKGWRATVEKPVLEGQGSVDVALERPGRSIACEISVTTNAEHEAGNLRKCLRAGFDLAVVIRSEEKGIERLREAVLDALPEVDRERVRVLTSEGFFTLLDGEGAREASGETVVRGRRVILKYRAVTEEEQKERKKTITHTLVQQALRKMKGGSP